MAKSQLGLWLIWLLPFVSFAQTAGDYQTRPGGGNWNGAATWQTYNGAAWVNTATPPTSANGIITILTGHTVTVTANVTADQIVVSNAATLAVNANITLLAGPAASMLYVVGGGFVTNNSGVIQGTALTNYFESGATYTHNYTLNNANGGEVPLAFWDPTSTIRVTGFSANTNYTLTSAGWSQSFGNFDYAAATQSNGREVNFNGLLTTIQGDFTISSIGGNNSTAIAFSNNQVSTLNILGSFSIANGVAITRKIYLRKTVAGSTTLNIGGNFSYLGGSIDLGANNSTGTINFNGAGVQTYSRAGATFPISNGRAINLTIASGSTVDFGTSSFNGLGAFTLSGTMRTGAATGLNGTLTNTGVKTFDSNCTITYNGAVAQVMGGLYPGAPAANVNVVINNAAGVTTSALTTPATLVTSITGNLTLQAGVLTVGGVHTLQLDGTVSRTAGNILMSAGSNLTVNGSGALGVDPFPFTADQTFTNFSLNRSGSTITLANNVNLNGITTLADGTLAIPSVQLTMHGDIIVTNGLISGNAAADLFIEGTGTVDVINFSGGGNTLGTLGINRSGASVQFGGDYTIANTLNVTAGTLEGDALNITMQGPTWSVDGGSGGFFNPGTSTVIFDGATTVTFASDFNNILLNTTRSLDLPTDDVNVSGDIELITGSIFNPNDGTVILNGAGDQIINGNGSEFYSLQVNKPSGEININSSLPIQHSFDVQSPSVINTNNQLLILSYGFTSDLDGAIGPVASGATINGNVTVQRYMDPVGNTYRYLASSVSSALPPASWGSTIYRYNGVSGAYATHSTATPLTIGTGYVIGKDMSAPITWSVSGPVHVGSYTWNFTGEGWYLIGNPYASAIRWFDSPGVAWDLTNMATTIAVTDNAVAGYPNYFRYWSYDPVNNPGDWGSGELANGMVTMGQAFWVYAGAGGGSLTIHESAKENILSGEFYRTNAATASNALKVTLDNGKYADVAYLKLNPQASAGYEFRYDLKKLKNQEMSVSLLDESKNELVMNAMDRIPGDLKIPVGIEVREPGEYTLSFTAMESFAYGNTLFLIDVYEGKAIPISEGSYRFTLNDITKLNINRFYLSLDQTVPERALSARVEFYPNPVQDKLTIRIPSNEVVNIRLIDHQGKEMMATQMKGSFQVDMQDYPQGMYVLRIASAREVIFHKVLLTK